MPLPSTAWQPGQSGNPNGGKMTAEIRKSLMDWQTDENNNPIHELGQDGKLRKVKRLQLAARALVNKAIKGDISAMQECLNRIDGRVPNDITVRRPNDLPATTFEELAQGVAEALIKLRGESQQVIENNGQSPDSEPKA